MKIVLTRIFVAHTYALGVRLDPLPCPLTGALFKRTKRSDVENLIADDQVCMATSSIGGSSSKGPKGPHVRNPIRLIIDGLSKHPIPSQL